MALGKPVICYLRQDDLKFIPDAMKNELPLINASPETIYAVLKAWLTDRREDLAHAGRSSRAYVESWHDPIKTAKRLKDAYGKVCRHRNCA